MNTEEDTLVIIREPAECESLAYGIVLSILPDVDDEHVDIRAREELGTLDLEVYIDLGCDVHVDDAYALRRELDEQFYDVATNHLWLDNEVE